jgi:hypothetical protein
MSSGKMIKIEFYSFCLLSLVSSFLSLHLTNQGVLDHMKREIRKYQTLTCFHTDDGNNGEEVNGNTCDKNRNTGSKTQ